jgi:hypothetical protein
MVSGRGWFDQHLYMAEFMRMLKESTAKEDVEVSAGSVRSS